MAKQKSRPEKRYVPQQESYRNLPGLRPTADTIVAAETPAPDSTGEKLRSLAEGLAAGNNALKDFFTMEKSFEETNRAEAKVRGQLGLPVGEGRGLLDYGVVAGHEEGRGLVDAQTAYLEVDRRLEQARYGISEDKLGTPEDTRAFVDKTVADVFKEQLASNPSQAYLEGAAKLMTQAKLESRVKGDAAWTAEEKKQRFNNFSKFVNTHWDMDIYSGIRADILQDKIPDPTKLRNTLSQLTQIGRDQYNFDRDTALVVVLDNFRGNLAKEMTKASSRDGSFMEIQDIEDTTQALLESLDVPDSTGIRLSDLKTPAVMQTVESIRATAENFGNRATALRAKNQELQADKAYDAGVKVLLDGGSFDDVQEIIKIGFSEGNLQGSTVMKLLAGFQESINSGVYSPVPEETMNKYLMEAISGNMSIKKLTQLQIDTKMPRRSFELVKEAISGAQNEASHWRSMESYALSKKSSELNISAQERAAIRTDNAEKLNSTLVDITDEELKFVKGVLTSTYRFDDIPIDLKDAEDVVSSARKTFSDFTRYREATRLALDESNTPAVGSAQEKANQGMANDAAILKFYPAGSSEFHRVQAEADAAFRRAKAKREATRTAPVQPTGVPVWVTPPQR